MSARRVALPVVSARAGTPRERAQDVALRDPALDAGHDVRRLDLFVTEACNLACDYCFESHKPRRTPALEQCERAIDWLVSGAAERVHVTLWGGEPLLRKDALAHLVAYARARAADAGKRAVTFSMPTNGTLLDEATLEWIAREEIQLFLSIDGDAEAQAGRPRNSGASSHALAMEGLRLAVAHLPAPPPVRMTVTPGNVDLVVRSVSHLAACGARELMVYPAYDADWSDEALARYAARQLELADRLVAWVHAADDPAAVPVLRAWLPTLRALADGVPPRPRRGPVRSCGAGGDLVGVAVDGALVPCHRFPSYARKRGDDASIGRLGEGLDAAARARFEPPRVEDMAGDVRCVECGAFDLCTYGCAAVSYVTTGRLDRVPHAACALVRAHVAACERAHRALRDDPRYALYLGRPLADVLRAAAKDLGARALAHYRREGAP